MREQMFRRRVPRERVLRAVVLGEAARTGEIIARLSDRRVAEVTSARAIADLIILWDPDPASVREIALWAARSCPHTVLIVASRDGLVSCRDAARASGLAPRLILCTGGMPHANREARLLAGRLDAAVSQTCVPVIGGEPPSGTIAVRRYATVAGIAAEALGDPGPTDWPPVAPVRPYDDGSLAQAAVSLGRAVLEDRRQVFSCGAWVQGTWGLPGGFVIAPVPVGARGASEPLPMRLTLEERSLLQRAAAIV